MSAGKEREQARKTDGDGWSLVTRSAETRAVGVSTLRSHKRGKDSRKERERVRDRKRRIG